MTYEYANEYAYSDGSEYAIDTCIYEAWMLPIMISKPSNVDWANVSVSPQEWMLPLMLANPDLLDWDVLYNLDDATLPRIYDWMLPLLLQNQDNINWYSIDLNLSDWMVPLIEIDPDQINWNHIEFEPWMVVLLDKFPNHAYAMNLSALQSPKATKRTHFNIDPTKSATARKRM